ncbi:MAG: SHOCT domain-containing protein, partial [Bacteroidota bacterium]
FALLVILTFSGAIGILGLIGWSIALFFIGVIWSLIETSIKNNKHKEISKSVFDNLEDFVADDSFISTTSGMSIGFDSERKKICILDTSFTPFFYNYSSILQSEIVIDGQTIIKQSTSGAIGRSLLGGMLGGGIGAIVGGTTGSRTQSEKINNIDLKIIVNDTVNPIFKINFLNVESKKGDFLYTGAYSLVEKWHGIFSVLIKQGDIENSSKSAISSSVADELKKLKGLLDEGVLTEDEFKKQKEKLIG